MTTLEHVEVVGDLRPRVGVRLRFDERWFLPLVAVAEAVAAFGAALVQLDRSPIWLVALGLPAVWLVVVTDAGAYARTSLSAHRVGTLVRPWCNYAGIAALACVLLGLGLPPVQFAGAVIAPLAVGEAARLGFRTILRHRHRQAQAVDRVLVVGNPAEVDELAGALARLTSHEYVVVGVCATDPETSSDVAPVVARIGGLDPDGDDLTVLTAAADLRASHVFVVPGAGLSGERLRRLAWAVQSAGLALVVVPGLVDVVDHRLHVRSVGRLTLLEVAEPDGRAQRLLKGAFDRAGALALLVLFAPVLAVTSVAVRLDSRGPALFRQRRVGLAGREFTMLKFRSMVVDAEQRLRALEAVNEADGHLFKLRQDPRITRVGRFIRRASLDELPQLVNVLRGDMALVGPRPPLPAEVAGYTEAERRRLRVKPGLTGLWQVSGRSDLTWDETVALDLHYVDNWTLAGDARLLARTTSAVLGGRGAY